MYLYAKREYMFHNILFIGWPDIQFHKDRPNAWLKMSLFWLLLLQSSITLFFSLDDIAEMESVSMLMQVTDTFHLFQQISLQYIWLP